MSNKEARPALAEEQSIAFSYYSPVSVSIYRAGRQMPHYHRSELEIIMCLEGTVEVYSMHEKHILHEGDIKEADTFDIHTVTSADDASDNLTVSFHFNLAHPLFADKGYELLYYVCSSDGIDKARKLALDRLRELLWALLYEWLHTNTAGVSTAIRADSKDRIASLASRVLQTLRDSFQYFNDINLDDTYSREMHDRFEHIIAYMLEHYAEKITMNDICQIEHLNYNYMSQFFKTTYLKTFQNFLHEIRVYHSEHLLLCRPDMPVPDIAYACGFSDPKLFYREFRRKHGHTPHQHRIWYRNYNRFTCPDETYLPDEKSSEIIQRIAAFFTGSIE
ncbi:MAG: AraC family transcriptional regulator [Eubacteriales bacterium]|nr:AraC family transcriptional regulator [Eubacteriales bacterium]